MDGLHMVTNASRQSFDKGALDCLRLGSEAASIQSAEENEWLSDLVRIVKWAPNLQHQGEFYIGLKYNGSSWQWSDGSHLTFENWHSGEPNELKTEQCVEVRAHNGDLNGSWNNVPCSAALYIVCQTQPE
ncbi:lectin c-type domain-containing protein [Ditylenchus destructor]|uniref:Lectin c-type domain-containing protein n=1 Tax=Ditylenchus destructor TaxID=166010 RepID=A0AAD4NFE0_9BILA|nr:lectin c-type domain-containing protein [Ditylenchus destructor]